ncbi:molybdopterin-dependent oxidoreductase [Luteolibacter flavescens]|uniref:Molybdopterin-dependent oxidoreductase n=1 Tax=Luteolibacter flavescens TaxID=1859460 RepID=A0ABT3FQS4_9BACT|nr:molybdopterin cofactor-binding domain-containing protein [Luteolibacter flavescens]MCW1885917.1 molybdopterin-dependent oxidoreductase [Luteolibacter flavescens]
MNETAAIGFDRRRFFKVLGGGVLAVCFAGPLAAQGRRGGGARPMELSAWIHIGEDGIIQVYTGKTEVGQNIRTSLAQAVAEELETPISSIRMVMADTDLVPYDAGTFGSRSTPDMALHLRKAAAAMKGELRKLAAKRWGITTHHVFAEDGRIVYYMPRPGNPPPRRAPLSYAELVKGKEIVAIIREESFLSSAENWKVLGTSVPKVDGPDFVTGKHHYTSDLKLPGMVHGKVLRSPRYGAKLKSLDDSAAKAMQGVEVIRDGDFIGVVAPSPWLAQKALDALKPEWEGGGGPSNSDLFALLKNNTGEGNAAVNEALATAAHRVEQTYTVEYIAHAPLECRSGVAEWKDGKVTAWTGTQRPFGVKDELAQAFSLPPEKVRVIVPDTGSGYGGKHSGEAAVEAARLAKAAGKPVKIVWTREEEFVWAYFRPAGVLEVKAGIDAEGKLVAWDFHNHNSGGAAIDTPYEVTAKNVRSHGSRSPLRQGSYRGLASAANCFARESVMDELAAAARMDPLDFRLKNLTDERLRAVLEAAAARFGWKDRKGHCGIACGIDKGGYLANCVEVDVKGKNVKVVRIVAAFECGAVVNPAHLKSQIEGSIVMGLGGALFESIQFAEGKILNPAFSKYRVPRFSDVPPIDIVLVNRKDLPSAGAGEAPILGIAPAIGSAIFAATGRRLRALPMKL